MMCVLVLEQLLFGCCTAHMCRPLMEGQWVEPSQHVETSRDTGWHHRIIACWRNCAAMSNYYS